MKKSGSFGQHSLGMNSSVSSGGRSFTDSLDLSGSIESSVKALDNKEWKKDKNCYICNRKFSMNKRRHHCRFCGNSVCDEHSLKRRALLGSKDLFRICDSCERSIQTEEVKKEIQEQLDRLESQLFQVRDSNERLMRDNIEKIESINQLEIELKKLEKEQRDKEEQLSASLRAEQDKSAKAKALVQQLQKEFEESQTVNEETSEKCRCLEDEIYRLRSQMDEVKDKKDELASQLTNMETKLKTSLPIQELDPTLCPRCRKRINEFFRIESVIIGEEDKNSIIDLIRQTSGKTEDRYRESDRLS